MKPNKRCRPLLGTYVEISVSNQTAAMDDAFETISQVQKLMSVHAHDSDVSRINRMNSEQSIQVHPWTWTVIRKALEINHHTDGAFDFTKQNTNGDMTDIHLAEKGIIHIRRPVTIDLGGIAKGFAVDQAIKTLQEWGVHQAVVNAGGDLRMYGDEPKLITIRDPKQPNQVIPAGYLTCGSIATSGPYYSIQKLKDATMTCALINPQTQLSICNLSSYSVIAPSCMDADALTKALAVHRNIEADYFRIYEAQALLH